MLFDLFIRNTYIQVHSCFAFILHTPLLQCLLGHHCLGSTLVGDNARVNMIHWLLLKACSLRSGHTDLPGEGKDSLLPLITAFHKGRCHFSSFPLRAGKSAQSIFLQISEHACHSSLLPVKSFYEIFYREICKYFDCLCHSAQTALQITHRSRTEQEGKLRRNLLGWHFS